MDDLAYDLEEKQQEILDLLREVQDLLRNAPESVQARAEAYWVAHIKCALINNHGYLGSSMATMEDTINELREEGGEF